ncbi:hypothetical protein [Amycolatopsis suaedae]|nr:hypothetical protein [Amycolatopsis suaedae]
MVREVVVRERVIERERRVSVTPQLVADWLPLLKQLERKVRYRPDMLARRPGELHDLARAVRNLHEAASQRAPTSPTTLTEGTAPSPKSEGYQLSRQQRRALAREQHKNRRYRTEI